jgi:periplasmic protein TonB
MNYTERQRAPARFPVGAGIVLVMHLLLAWALVTSLARKVFDAIKAPVETKIIEDVKPPPPETPPPPSPEFAPPRPVFVPAPELRITVSPRIAPTITATTTVAPPAPVTISPVVQAAPSSSSPAASTVRVALPAPAMPTRTAPSLDFNQCAKPEYGAAAVRAGVTGTVVVSYAMDTRGSVSETKVERSAGASPEHKILDRWTVDAVINCRGRPGTVDGTPETLRGSVEYVWRLE